MPNKAAFTTEFAEWLLPAVPNPTPELTGSRWDAVSDTALRIGDSTDEILSCVRLVLGLPVSRAETEAFREAFIQRDPSFASGSNDLEMQILAGSTLAKVMRSGSSGAELAVLGLLAGAACDARLNQRNRHFIDLARRERKRIAMRDDAADAWPILVEEGSVDADDATTPDADQLAQVARFATELSDFGERGYARLREESSIAWWVLGQYSRDLDVPVQRLPPKAAPIILGKELADLTRTEVGPVAASAVLWRMLTLNRKTPGTTSFEVAIEACPTEWISTTAATALGADLDVLTPVLRGMKTRQAMAGAGWSASFRAVGGLTGDVECEAIALASQVYFECLLVRAISRQAE